MVAISKTFKFINRINLNKISNNKYNLKEAFIDLNDSNISDFNYKIYLASNFISIMTFCQIN